MEKIFATPPLQVSDLATLLGEKPYIILAHLIEASVFLSPKAPVPAENAIEIARKLGFELHFLHPN